MPPMSLQPNATNVPHFGDTNVLLIPMPPMSPTLGTPMFLQPQCHQCHFQPNATNIPYFGDTNIPPTPMPPMSLPTQCHQRPPFWGHQRPFSPIATDVPPTPMPPTPLQTPVPPASPTSGIHQRPFSPNATNIPHFGDTNVLLIPMPPMSPTLGTPTSF